MSRTSQTRLIPALILVVAGLAVTLTAAQTTSAGPAVNFTAVTDNLASPHDSIRIEILRWSTDEERDRLLAAWEMKAPPPRAGRGRGGPVLDDDPALEGVNPTAPARAGRGGRGGRGGGAPAPRLTPERLLELALTSAPTVGYLWSSEVAGYALRSAVRLPQPDGGERILLITERRLGAWNDLWKPASAAADSGPALNYEFSVIELHLNSKGEGEGRVSLAGNIAADTAAKTIALENYAALPVVLKNVKRRVSGK